MTINELLARIIEEAGYLPEIQDESVCFRCEGTRFWFETFPGDVGYLRLMTGFIAPPDADVDAMLRSANEGNRRLKAVKTVVLPNPDEPYVTFAIEMFTADLGVWATSLERCLDALRGASDAFFMGLKPVEV